MAAWLLVNSIRTERIQFAMLQLQNLGNVWPLGGKLRGQGGGLDAEWWMRSATCELVKEHQLMELTDLMVSG